MPRALAWLAASVARSVPAWTPACLINSRTEIFAYQLEPALAMLAGQRRILIADGVGLGKTIQAALIIAETLKRRPDARVLVIAPASLVAQWISELHGRFAIVALPADAGTFTRLRSEHLYLNNPWTTPGVWLASADFLKQPHVLEAIPQSPFDLVVIDEAHIMAGNSQRHSAADALGRSAHRVVLLTATPHDGDDVRYTRLISLAASGSPADAITIFRRTRTSSVRHIRTLDVHPGSGLSRVLAAIDAFESAGHSGTAGEGLRLICGVFRKRALSSLAALSASLSRRLTLVSSTSSDWETDAWTQPVLRFDLDGNSGADDGDLLSQDEWPVLTAVTGLPRKREQTWLERLLSLTSRAAALSSTGDPKMARLRDLLRRSREPVVVFTEYRDSLLAIAEALATHRRVAVLHGGLTGADQRRGLRAFLDGDADVLLATDVASQGLNLQHRTRWVIHFDVPWTPMRLEQRVGRVDRIGQLRRVHVTSIGLRHRAQVALRQRVARREEVRDQVTLRSCRRWTRAAEGLARFFARQRALAARWQGPDPVAVPRARVTSLTLRHLGIALPCTSQPITIVEIPLISNTGEVLECWFGHDRGEDNGKPPTLLGRRARALTARLKRRLAQEQPVDPSASRQVLSQPGLFEARGLNAVHANTDSRDELIERALDACVHVGTPRPVLILERRS